MDPQRSVTRCPADDFDASVDDVVNGIEFYPGMTRIQLICAALDVLAAGKGKEGWVALDLHPEFYFAEYAKRIPGLRLAIVLRDPLEAAAAALYWRTYPRRMPGATRHLKYAGVLWRLSAACGIALRRSQGRKVCFIDGGRILAGACGFAAFSVFPGKGAFNGPAFFTSRAKNGQLQFHCPDGRWRPLLEPEEVSQINRWRVDFWPDSDLDDAGNPAIAGAGRHIWRLASSVPSTAKRVVDGYFSPRTTLLRLANRVKPWT